MRALLGALLAVAQLAGCAASPGASAPLPTWPVPVEVLPSAVSGAPDAQLTCGGQSFPASGLAAPTGAERASGPQYDALRATLAALHGSQAWTWRVAGRTGTGVVLLAQTGTPDQPVWMSIELTAGGSGWLPGSLGDCSLRVVLSADYGPAEWALDPAFPTPTASSIELHILVWERACSGGSPTTGRMSAPVIQYDATTVTITIGVRPLTGPQLCPLGPGTPAIVELGEPLGARTLLDGGLVPPAAPTSPPG